MVKKRTYTRSGMFHGAGNNPGTLILFFSVSTIFHLIFFVVLIIIPDFTPKRKYSPAAINVSLVTIPDQGKPRISGGKAIVKPPERAVTQKAYKKPSKTVSVAPAKKKVKKSLKKKTFKSDKVVKSAISELEKKIDKSRPQPLTEALERLKREVEKTGPGKQLEKNSIKGVKDQNAGIHGRPGAKGGKTLEIMQIYNAEIAYQIEKNWVFSEDFAGNSTDLEAALAIKIMPNGEIKEIWFDKKSGNSFLDDSAYKAIMKSNPLPPLPKSFLFPYYTVGLKFGPKGIK